MPTLRLYPNALTAAAGARGWTNPGNMLGVDTAAWATLAVSTSIDIVPLALGGWRTAAGLTAQNALPPDAILQPCTFGATTRSSGIEVMGLIAFARLDGLGHGATGLALATGAAFTLGTSSFGSLVPDVLDADFVTTAVFQPNPTASTLDVKSVFIDVPYSVPRYLRVGAAEVSDVRIGSTPISAAWLNGLRVWP
jgi:hypothetical protein